MKKKKETKPINKIEPEEKKKKRKRRKRTKNHYFTQIHEDAIIEYSSTFDPKIRADLYSQYIAPAFNEMVDKIVYTYRFTTIPNIEVLQEECKTWLTTIIDKFDPSKGSKAFSYFSVITKNWFIHKTKETSIKSKKEVYFEEISNELEHELSIDNFYMIRREECEFWKYLTEEMDNWENDDDLKENEKKILMAIRILFENINDIDIFNKKAIYLYIREITNLNTKQVVGNLNKIRERYRLFKADWDDSEI